MEMNLRSAIVISFIIHASLFAPFYNHHLIKMELEKRNSVVVDYIVLKEIIEAINTNKEVVLRTPETSQIDIQKDITVKQQEAARKEADFKKSAQANQLKAKDDDVLKVASSESAKKEAALKSDKDYISYYELIREKIRARLKNNYKYYKNEGDVYLSFTINPNGSLLIYNIDRAKSTTDEVLLHITSTSIKAVSPFPPIPRTLSLPKISFSIVISFKM